MFGLSVTVAGTGLGVGGWVSGILNIPAPMGAPGPLQGRGFSHSWGCRSRAFTVPCCWFLPTCGSGAGVTGPIRCVMCRLLPQRWRRSSPAVTSPAATRSTYRQALGPLVETVGADRPVTDLCPDRVAAPQGRRVAPQRQDGSPTSARPGVSLTDPLSLGATPRGGALRPFAQECLVARRC